MRSCSQVRFLNSGVALQARRVAGQHHPARLQHIAAAGAWLAERKGYSERLGLMLGLILSVPGLVIALLLPGRSGSKWRTDGWLPRRQARRG